MDGISSEMVAQSVEAVNQVMQSAQAQTIEIAQKMIAMTAEIKVGVEAGKGELIDILV